MFTHIIDIQLLKIRHYSMNMASTDGDNTDNNYIIVIWTFYNCNRYKASKR